MSTQNIFTIQLQESREDTSGRAVAPKEWDHCKDKYTSITELKKIRLSVYKERLNLYNEKCRIKDDVILALQTCLETYKNTNNQNNELIGFLKSKLAERKTAFLSVKSTYSDQIANCETVIKEKNEQIFTQEVRLKDKDKQIEALENKLTNIAEGLKEQNNLIVKYKEQIIVLQKRLDQTLIPISDQPTTSKEAESNDGSNDDIPKTSAELVKCWKPQNDLSQIVYSKDAQKAKLEADLKLTADKIKKQNNRLLLYTIKEVQDNLESTEIKLISLPRIGPFKVVYANSTQGPGWIVIQRRIKQMVDFNQGWFAYVDGFGDIDSDFWIGLDKLYALTKNRNHELYVHLVYPNNEIRYAYYDKFAINGKNDDYKLRLLGSYFGNAGDGLRLHENHIFKTIKFERNNVVEYNRWWQREYPNCNLNGAFDQRNEFGVWWCRIKGAYQFIESVQMLIRPSVN